MFYIYLTYLLTFYISSGLFFIYDYNKNYKKISQYKKINFTVTKNSFIYIPLITCPGEYYFFKLKNFNLYFSIYKIIIGLLLIDFFFYICHRLMHINLIYKWSHKLHHEYKYPVGMEALYLHWFDLYFGNILPLYLPMLGSDIYTLMIWTIIVISITVITHSNVNNNSHLKHHKLFNCNFGIDLYMDRLLKTN